jgi:hypothetical protein
VNRDINLKSSIIPAAGALGDFWMYDTRSLAWTELAPAGAPASSSRVGLGLVAVRSKLYLYGGTSETGTMFKLFLGSNQCNQS